MNAPKPLLTTRGLAIGYKSGRELRVVSEKLNLNLFPGQLICVLGPNGAGKSTLMRTLAGLQQSLAGQIDIEEQSLTELGPSKLARKLSLVLTERVEAGNLTVNEVVALGRTPYSGWLGSLTAIDAEVIRQALESTQMTDFKNKKIRQLSDGERQKVMLARALAQDTPLILLDEPTAHLDLPSRVAMMHLLHTLARQTQKAILLSTHELDLALQAADQLWLMRQDGQLLTGVPEDLVLNGAFESTFAKTGFYFDKSSGNFTIYRQEESFNIHVSGSPDFVFWTKRALYREGIGTDSQPNSPYRLVIAGDTGQVQWSLDWQSNNSKYVNLETLLNAIRLLRKGII